MAKDIAESTELDLLVEDELKATGISQDAFSNVDLLDDNEGSDSVVSNAAIKQNNDNEIAQVAEDLKSSPIQLFMEGAQMGNMPLLKEYIESKIVDVNDRDSENVSALHWAAINNRLAAVKYLVSKGAEVDAIGGNLNSTPLQWACRTGLVYIADFLITECKADPGLTDDHGFNCLHSSVHSSNIMMVLYILYMTPISVDLPDPNGRTSLHWAAYQGDMYSVNVLLAQGANANAVDSIGFLPLHWALTRNVKPIFISLLKKDTNLFLKTNDGKDTFEIASDMNCADTLRAALKESGFDFQGMKAKHILSEKAAKAITFFSPYIVLPLVLRVLSISQGYGILKVLLAVSLFFIENFCLLKFILPCYISTPSPLIKSPYFSGVFSATAVWVCLTWFFQVLPMTFGEAPFRNFLFLTFAASTLSSFFKAMVIDPGCVPADTNRESVQETIKDLLEKRKFNDKNFCINTYVRIPLRSKYSYNTKSLVAKFDHSCPWINNEVGVRNHKLFYAFIVTLAGSILLFVSLAGEYFDELDIEEDTCWLLNEEYCTGYHFSPFVFNVTVWSLLQFIWLAILVLGQTIQISKGLTTYEAAHLRHAHQASNASTPYDVREEDSDFSRSDAGLAASSPSSHHNHSHQNASLGQRIFGMIPIPRFLVDSKVCKMLGVSHFLLSTPELLGGNNKKVQNYNYGFRQNWVDFLFVRREGEGCTMKNLFKIPTEGESNLNGKLINFYKLYNPLSPLGEEIV